MTAPGDVVIVNAVRTPFGRLGGGARAIPGIGPGVAVVEEVRVSRSYAGILVRAIPWCYLWNPAFARHPPGHI